jgi:cyanophycinase
MRYGYLLLEGGAEFGGRMADPDRRALELAGGLDVPLCILPTAAAPDHNHNRAGQNGKRWFESLGARQVTVLPVIDPASANSPENAAAIQHSRLVYLLGGFTHYLGQTLSGSLCAEAMLQAYQDGAVIAGSSAGAMVLCQHYYHPGGGSIAQGLNFVPGSCFLPHHNTFGQDWAARLAELLPEQVLIGVDEQTGILDDGPGGTWNVYGKGAATIYRKGQAAVYHPGQSFSF